MGRFHSPATTLAWNHGSPRPSAISSAIAYSATDSLLVPGVIKTTGKDQLLSRRTCVCRLGRTNRRVESSQLRVSAAPIGKGRSVRYAKGRCWMRLLAVVRRPHCLSLSLALAALLLLLAPGAR